MSLPFDGAISRYFETEAPDAIRTAIREGEKRTSSTPPTPTTPG
jgi:polyphosphate kinase